MLAPHPGHVVCIFGGAIAGSEAAHRLAQLGIYSVVMEQEALPYGKIEHGLPKWHIKLRDKEERQIDDKLCDPHVRYVPCCRLGRDIGFDEVRAFGFSAILLAVGAWKDRLLPIEGIDDFQGKGFYYQNPFVMWFNQCHSPNYQGPQLEVADDAVVVGGGLASIDVVKILMLETTLRALRERGLESDLFTLEKKGIPSVLADLGVSWESLGLKGCTLYYRRRTEDMPLNEIPSQAPPEKREKMGLVRHKLMDVARAKYLFRFQPARVPVGKIVREGRLAGLVFQKTEVSDGRVSSIAGSEHEVASPLVISSIGSLPEPIEGLPMEWGLIPVESEANGQVKGFDNVFALGNTVTGRGNIRASLMHGRQVADYVAEGYFAWSEDDYRFLIEAEREKGGSRAEEIGAFLRRKRVLSQEKVEAMFRRIATLQERVGYDGDYRSWAERKAFVRLETLIGYQG